MEHPNELDQQLENLRTLQQSYDILANNAVSSAVAGELESGKAAIITAINAMGGTATSDMSLGELANAIRALIIVQLGELEYDIPIESAEEALNLASTHCTKFVDDYTVIMTTPLIVDEWQAVEEVRYKKLLDYNFTQFSSDERKSGVYALTMCHNLRKLMFDVLRTISLTDSSSQFVHGNAIRLEELNFPSLQSITLNTGATACNCQVFSGLGSLNTIIAQSLQSIVVYATSDAGSNVFSNLTSLETLNLPDITSISVQFDGGFCNLFSNMSALTSISMPGLQSIVVKTNNQNGYRSSNPNVFTGMGLLETLSLPSVKTIELTVVNTASALGSRNLFTGLSSLKVLSLPAITAIRNNASSSGSQNLFTGAVNLIDIEIGHTDEFGVGSITENMRLNGINPTNVYSSIEDLATLNESIRTKWFANLYDYTGGTAHTLTLASQLVSHLEAETIQVATDKNWTIVTV